MIRGTSEGSETSELEYSTTRIQFCLVQWRLGIIWKVILKKEVKIDFTKIDQADSDFLRRELSNGSLKIVVAITIFRELIFVCACLGGPQFSCSLLLAKCTFCQTKWIKFAK